MRQRPTALSRGTAPRWCWCNWSAESTQALGYTYADAGTAAAAQKLLERIVLGSDPLRHAATLQKMLRSIRNLGETGIAMMAVSAIDNAIWDLRARLLDLPLVSLLGQVRTGIPVYGSGGFTSYPIGSFPISLAAGQRMDSPASR